MIQDDIRILLEAPAAGAGAPSLDRIEDTLTAGYARAMALEGERRRVERRLTEVVEQLGADAGDPTPSELAGLGNRLRAADRDLAALRALLGSLRVRASSARAA